MHDVSYWVLAKDFFLPRFHVLTKKANCFPNIFDWINHSYLVSKLNNAKNKSFAFAMSSGYSVEEKGAETVIKALRSEKMVQL